MPKPCDCKTARAWLLGYAAAQCAATKAGFTVYPFFNVPPVFTEDAPALIRRDCPPECDPADCNQLYTDFSLLYNACLTPECRAQVQAAYDAAVANCGAGS